MKQFPDKWYEKQWLKEEKNEIQTDHYPESQENRTCQYKIFYALRREKSQKYLKDTNKIKYILKNNKRYWYGTRLSIFTRWLIFKLNKLLFLTEIIDFLYSQSLAQSFAT